MEEHKGLFHNEILYLKKVKDFQERDNITLDEVKSELSHVTEEFERLLGDTRVITKMSDRLQRRLTNANEELENKNAEIERKNVELQNTIDALTKARISRKATTITLIVAVLLFIVSEGFLEPFVENETQTFGFSKSASFWIGFIAKGVIALLLTPIDYLVKLYLTKGARKRKEQAVFKS